MDFDFKKAKGAHGEVRATPMPSQADLDRFYREAYYGDGVSDTYSIDYSVDELAQKRLRAAATVEAVLQSLSGLGHSPKGLEVGSGEGFVLAEAMARGIELEGVDYQAAPVKKLNPDVMPRFHEAEPAAFLADRITAGSKYDLLILQNVLEHVRDPDGLLAELRALMSEDAVLLVQVPNDFSALQSLAMEQGRMLQETWFAPPQHLTYWNTDTIGPYLAAHGFDIVDGFSDFPIEIFLLGGPESYAINRELGRHAHRARVTLDLFVARNGLGAYLDLYRALYGVGLGRNMVLVLRKA